MFIYINLNETVNAYGKAIYIKPEVRVEHSPKEGFDHETVRILERELEELVERRLREAISTGGQNTCKDITF